MEVDRTVLSSAQFVKKPFFELSEPQNNYLSLNLKILPKTWLLLDYSIMLGSKVEGFNAFPSQNVQDDTLQSLK